MVNEKQFPPLLHNVLPLRFPTWTSCYDSIPDSQRQEARFHFYQGLNKKQFIKVYGYLQPSHIVGKAEHIIEREWLLARIGEELLEARLTLTELKEIQKAVWHSPSLVYKNQFYLVINALSRLLKTVIRDKQQ